MKYLFYASVIFQIALAAAAVVWVVSLVRTANFALSIAPYMINCGS